MNDLVESCVTFLLVTGSAATHLALPSIPSQGRAVSLTRGFDRVNEPNHNQIRYLSLRFWKASTPPSRISQACSRIPAESSTSFSFGSFGLLCSSEPVK